MSEQQQTSAEFFAGKLAGQFSSIDAILGAIGGDYTSVVSTCVRLTAEKAELEKKLAELTEKKA